MQRNDWELILMNVVPQLNQTNYYRLQIPMFAAVHCLLLQNHSYDFPFRGERESKKCITLFIAQHSFLFHICTHIFVCIKLIQLLTFMFSFVFTNCTQLLCGCQGGYMQLWRKACAPQSAYTTWYHWGSPKELSILELSIHFFGDRNSF